jgi:hypothetical protein
VVESGKARGLRLQEYLFWEGEDDEEEEVEEEHEDTATVLYEKDEIEDPEDGRRFPRTVGLSFLAPSRTELVRCCDRRIFCECREEFL